jgi:heavy metal efflux system protein
VLKKVLKSHLGVLLFSPNIGLKMLNFLIHFSIRNKLIVGLCVVVLIAFGCFELTRLPIDAVPDITDNQVQIITVTPSLGAPEVERLITFPIEQATANVPNIVEMRSFSRFGLSLVTVVFSDKTDVYWARQQITERLQKVQTELPKGIGTPELAPVTTGLGEIFQYVVRPKTGFEKAFSPTDLRTIQDWIVRRQLLGVEGVADVSSFGGALKQYEIAINPDRLKAQGLTIADIFNAVEKNNQNTGGAYIEKGPTVLYIRSEGLVGSMADIEAISVKNTEGSLPILISDVATVKLGNATRYGAMCFNDKGEVAGAVVMMLKGENSSKVILKVKERIAEIQKTLPEGVLIEAFLDRTKMVNNAISTVETNLMEGALIVIFVLVLFLGNIRAGLLVASVIPLAMLFAVILMNLFGVSGNLMSLGALDFGLIIDGAVIIVEAVLHVLSNPHASTNVFANSFAPVTANSFAEETDETTAYNKSNSRNYSANKFAGTGANEFANTTTNAFDTQVENTTKKMMNAAVFGQIIILIVYLPILSLQGIEGKMFRPMAETVAFALLGAFILSLTYVPMMSALLLKNTAQTPNFADRFMAFVAKKYQKGLFQILRFPKLVVGLALGLLVISTLILRGLGGEFIPKLEEGDFAVDTRVLTGSSLTTTIEATQKTAKILLERFPEVEKVVTKIGSGEIPTDPMPIEASDMMVILKDKKLWTSAKTFDELAEKMSIAVSDVPGVTAGFQFPVQMRFNELMTGARQDVVCKIFGEDLDSLALYADKLGNIAGKLEGAKDLYVETVTGMPQITVEYDRAAIARFCLTIEDVNRTLKTAFAGESAGVLYEGERRFDIVVKLEGSERKDLSNVQNLLIATPKGEQIPLSMVAKVAIKEGLNQIQREDAKRRITVGFNARGVDIQTLVEKLKTETDKNLKLPVGYRLTFGGQFENLNAAKLRLSIAVPVALLLIFLMLYFAFGSIKQGLLVFSAIPLATIGGVFALWLRGMPFSISAGIGFIALFGVAVLNGIVLISECNRLKSDGHAYLKGIVLTATKTRLRPVLMTAAVASLGFLPMALSNGSGAEVQRPLATVVIGGLLTATLLTLFVLPILYLIFEKKGPLSIKRKIGVFMLIFMLFSNQIFSQNIVNQEITLEQAFELAIKNNPQLQTERLKITQFERLEGTAFDLPRTDFGAEFGQFNSRAFDTKLSASQSFSSPKIYQQRAVLLKAETELQRRQVTLSAAQLKYDIATIYYEMLFLKKQKRLFLKQDSVLATNLRNADIRLKTGESGILEKTTAETQRLKLQHQLQQLDLELDFYQIQLKNRVYTEGSLFSENQNLKADFSLTNDTTLLNNHPELAYFKQQIEVAQQQILVDKNTLKPSFSIGYALQSIQGTQTFSGRDYAYNAVPQFSTIQFGMQLPLFKKATKSRIEAAKIGQTIAENQLAAKELMRKKYFQELGEQFKKATQNVDFYEKTALPQAKRLIEIADISRRNGEIGYAEWSLATMQSWTIEQEYLEATRAYNRVVVDIQTLFDFKK